jgi:hypothetical protein
MTSPTNGRPAAALSDLLDQLAGTAPASGQPQGWPTTTPAPSDPPPGPQADDEGPEPAFDDLAAFVDGYLTQVVERRVLTGNVSGLYWCTSWWAHPEALSRIYALWREWEKARVDDTMSTWWLHHLDPHLASLTAEYGPFCKCEPGKHANKPLTLQSEPVPDEVLAQLPEG